MLRERRVRLVAELTGVAGNLVLTDESGMIIAVREREDSPRRKLAPGIQYRPLPVPAPSEKSKQTRFANAVDATDPLSLHREIQSHYAEIEAREAESNLRSMLAKVVGRRLQRARRKLEKIHAQLVSARDFDAIRQKGELLKTVLTRISRGQASVEVENTFDAERPMVSIELDPRLTPRDNLARIFASYKKAKSSLAVLRERRDRASKEVQQLERLVEAVGTATAAELPALRAEVGEGVGAPAAEGGRNTRSRRTGPRHFRSVDGLEILVARSSRENAELTFSIARGNDYWLHVRGWPGPHVVIRRPSDRNVSREALLDAAHLAVHFSKIRGTAYAEVTYTQCKHVRRLKGASTGNVSYASATTLQVPMDGARLARLLEQQRET
jgi:predicted ribosome quality control (RQC) complex YloA/Tae2 family protein